jgi:2',3'-cyclic-nucleotide 2'-phosphodiesterase (5'-nucleotidase family)
MKSAWLPASVAVGILVVMAGLCLGDGPKDPFLTLLVGDTVNGRLEPCPSCDGSNALGGLARRGSWIQEARETHGECLILDSGNLFFEKYREPVQAGEVEALAEKARLILRGYHLLGYDAIGIGNDDLTLGKDFLADLEKDAAIPFLASNLVDSRTGRPLFRTHLIRETGGLRVGVFSLLCPDFFSGESDPRIKGIVIQPPLEQARSMVREMRSKTDLVILLSHLGYVMDVELAETVPGIDIIIGGHSGIPLSYPMFVKDSVIIQMGTNGLNGKEARLGFQHRGAAFYDPDAKGQPNRGLEQEGKNPFFLTSIPLSHTFKEHRAIAEMVRGYKAVYFPE